jgi:DNA-binding NarL/FixJ family response regulator
MSTVATPAGPAASVAAGPALKVTQGRVLLSEFTKFRSLRSTLYTLLTAVVLMIGIGALATALTKLTDREQDVFLQLAAGRSNREIAQDLHLSEGTVKLHVGRILAKLDLRDRVQAVVLAYESGLITPGS